MARLSPLAFRRVLRKKSTDAEHELWSRLRRHRMGPKFRRQHTVGPYTLDFYCPAARLAVELDGGQHYEGPQVEKDGARDASFRKTRFRGQARTQLAAHLVAAAYSLLRISKLVPA